METELTKILPPPASRVLPPKGDNHAASCPPLGEVPEGRRRMFVIGFWAAWNQYSFYIKTLQKLSL